VFAAAKVLLSAEEFGDILRDAIERQSKWASDGQALVIECRARLFGRGSQPPSLPISLPPPGQQSSTLIDSFIIIKGRAI
jgi:hypothetical protein